MVLKAVSLMSQNIMDNSEDKLNQLLYKTGIVGGVD
jgi:hypothetical protein